MDANLRQTGTENRRRGLAKSVAVLRMEPSELAQRFGISFEEHSDDLGALNAAVFETTGGKQFGLLRHKGCPSPGTEVLVDEKSTNPSADLKEFMTLLGITEEDILLTAPGILIS